MPALTIYGRGWYTTSDMLPLPALLFAIAALVWLVVFSISIGNLDVWGVLCRGQGVHYVVTTAGLVSVYGASFLLAAGIMVIGLRGTCLEVSKRRFVVHLLYVQTFVWVAQAAFMVYGTTIMYTAKPSCWNKPGSRKSMRELTHAMIYSTWGLVIFTLLIVWLVYNSYQGQDNLRAWEERLKRMSYFLCCRDAVVNPIAGRGAPLPSIAQWISGLFANVNLSPTDLTEALILTAAAQSLRRRMRIKKALAAVSPTRGDDHDDDDDGSSVTSSMTSLDGMSSVVYGQNVETDTSDDEAHDSNADTKQRAGIAGALDDPTISPNGTSNVAVPEDYPLDWSRMARQAYDQTAKKLHTDGGAKRDQDGIKAEEEKDRERQAPGNQGVEENKARRSSGGCGGSFTSAFAECSLQSLAGSDSSHHPAEAGPADASDGPSASKKGSMADSPLSLSQVDNQMLEDFDKALRRADDPQLLTPKERFGIQGGKKRTRLEQAATESELESTPLGHGKTRSGQKTSKGMHSSRGDPSLPPKLSGKLQAGLNEQEGGLPPAEEGSISQAFTFESSILQTGGQTSLEVDASCLLSETAELRLDAEDAMVVPLERDLDDQLPPVITPSEQVVQTAGHTISVKQAIEEAVGRWEMAEYEALDEATNWVRFASAVYAVMPFSEQGYASKMCLCQQSVTEESVRDSVLELAGIEEEDLLYFSHSNIALSHLPYMVAIDRKTKTVVVAIRGTMSLADLVTDAVVHPEPLTSWLPTATRKVKRKARGGDKKAYAHGGITSAAKAVLEDLEVHGILNTLLQPEEVRRKSVEYRRAQGRDLQRPDGAVDRAEPQSGETRSAASKRTEGGRLSWDTEGVQSGGVWPSGSLRAQPAANGNAEEQCTRAERDEMASAARQSSGTTREQGEATGEAIQKNLDSKGWKLVLTGHSLGAGAAALIGLKLHDRYPDLKVWAFSPPGGLISRSLIGFTEQWCTSVAVGKDVVPRMTVNNLNRLMDEMVTSLARCRYPKLRVLFGRWWRKESRPPPQCLFHSYRSIPLEARLTLEKYHESTARKGKAKDMFPPGRVLFVRPVKMLVKAERQVQEKRLKQAWDAVWISSQVLVAEGILVSRKMLTHHSITNSILDALGYATRHHPNNPKPEAQKREEKQEEEEMKDELEEVRVEDVGGVDLMSAGSQ